MPSTDLLSQETGQDVSSCIHLAVETDSRTSSPSMKGPVPIAQDTLQINKFFFTRYLSLLNYILTSIDNHSKAGERYDGLWSGSVVRLGTVKAAKKFLVNVYIGRLFTAIKLNLDLSIGISICQESGC